MALEIDLSAANTVSSDINPINEVVETPATPPIDLPDTVVIAQGFIAGTVDGSVPGFGGLVGSGLISPGFFGVDENHTLTYFLASQGFDYSSSAYPEIGKTETGEFRLGNDVSADKDGILAGSSYLRYKPSIGLSIHNAKILIDGDNATVWVGDVIAETGAADIDGTGVGIVQDGIIATYEGTITFGLLSSGSVFAVGDNVAQDPNTYEFLGSKYLAYTRDKGLEIKGGSITVSDDGFVWVGGDLGAYVRGETTSLPNGVGLIHNLDVNNTTISGIAALHNQELKFSVDENTGNVYILDGTINIGSSGYVWVGDWTSSLLPDFNKGGVGIWNAGLGSVSNGSVTFFIDKDTGRFAFGENVDIDKVTTTKGIYFDEYGNVVCENISMLLPNTGYVWVGDVTDEHTIDLTGSGVGLWSIGLAALSTGEVTVYIDATSGYFAFGENVNLSSVSTTKGVAYDGTNLNLTNIDLINKDSGGNTTVSITSAGDMTLGSETTHQLKYIAADGALSIDGANIGVGNNSYVWVGDSDLSNGCGLAGGVSGLTDGFYATHSGDITAFISAVDGSFTFGKTSGPHINYDGTNLDLIDLSDVWVGSADHSSGVGLRNTATESGFYARNAGAQTVFIDANDGTFTFGAADKCIKYTGNSLDLVGVDLLISSGHYTWVGDADLSNGIGLAENVNGISGLIATSGGEITQYIKSDGTFQLGKSSRSYISFNGTDVVLNKTNIINRNSADEITVNIDFDGNLTLGTPASHQLTYVSNTGTLAIDGVNIGVNNNSYVWVGTPDFSTGCGMIGGVSSQSDGFYCGYAGDVTVHISAVDGSFTFGKVSGPHIQYDSTTLALYDTNINVTGGYVWAGVGTPGIGTGVGLVYSGLYAFNGTTQTAFISATDGSFKFGTNDHCIEFDGTDALNLTGVNTILGSDNYVWVGTPVTQGCGICAAGIYGTDANGNQTVLIRADDGSFKLGGDYYLALSASGKLTLKISDYAADFVATTNAPESNATVGAKAGTNVFASSGTVLHDSDIVTIQGTADNAQNYTGNSIQTIFTDAKCTDPYADQTSTHKADNTSHVNGSVTDGGNSYIVSNGDIKMYNDHDIKFYHGAGSYLYGEILASMYGLEIKSSLKDVIFNASSITIKTSGNAGIPRTNNVIILDSNSGVCCLYDIFPYWDNYANLGKPSYQFNTVYAHNLGSSSYKIENIYTNYIGSSSYKASTVYATTIGQYNSKVSYVYTNYLGYSNYPTGHIYSSHLSVNSNNITMGSSSNYFQLHIYAGGSWNAYPCYITQS